MAPPMILGEPVLLPMLILLAVIWLLPQTPFPDKIATRVKQQYQDLPKVKFDFHPQQTFASRYPANKTAIYIEPRTGVKHITPLLVHMMEIVPPEWRFVFLGSEQTASTAASSGSARRYQEWGKLRIGKLERWSAAWGPRWDDLGVDEMISRLLTNTSFYDVELPGTEHLFVFHSDAILCANSNLDLNEWLEYDYVGAPWNNDAKFGGSGGLSLRRVSKIREVLRFQARLDHSSPEDAWLSSRMGLLPDAKMAGPDAQKAFAVHDVWAERPMGYHVNTAWNADVWQPREKRQIIFEYCPEIKMIMEMNLERERCPKRVDLLEGFELEEGESVVSVPDPRYGEKEGVEEGIVKIDAKGMAMVNT